VTVGYLVLGILLVVMGGAQTWLRHTTPEADAARRGVRSGKAWNKWTAIQGPIAVGLGIVLIVLGVMGR